MRKLIWSLIAGLVLNVALVAQSNDSCRIEALKLISIIQKYHISPPEIDSSFSSGVFDGFISRMDPKKIYITEEEYDLLNKSRYDLINGLNTNKWNFFSIASDLYKRKLREFIYLTKSILIDSLNLNNKETFNFKEPEFSSSGNPYIAHVRKWLTYRVLNQMFLINDSISNLKDYSGIEQIARNKVLKLETGKIIKRLSQPGYVDHFISLAFLNAIAGTVDPHSEYMSKNEKAMFQNSLESEKLSFGMELDINENEELEITGLIPGGPAWKSNIIHKGDIIEGFKLPGFPKIDIDSIDPEEANAIILSGENKKVEFYVRKPGGIIKSVVLIKAVLEQEENKIKSCVLNGKTKIGYISLPAFYTEFENHSGLGCANDLAKECIKLLKDNISGLIIDLRNNGGGSVKEAIDLSGLFIDYGPICITKEKNERISVVKDFNRGTAYTGPLVIMVNKQSASASEIFAAAMQDYRRALIIGEKTFGKATAQVIIPVNTELKDKDNSGFVKLTIEKVYRINGKSNQRKGVVPDVILPDLLNSVIKSEDDEKQSLRNDTVKQAFFVPWHEFSMEEAKSECSSRIVNNVWFNNIKNLSDSIQLFISGYKEVPVDLKGFSAFYSKKIKFINIIDRVFESEEMPYKVEEVSFNRSLKPLQSEEDIAFFKLVEKSIYISEAYNAVNDLITLKTKNINQP